MFAFCLLKIIILCRLSTILMKYVIAFFLPWLSLMIQGKILSGMLCLLLQLTLIGWIPAFIWAITSLNRMYADRRTQEIIKAIKEEKSNYYKF